MTGLEENHHAGKHGYFMPANLVNKLIVAIITAILTIGGYMILWAINDAAYKTLQETKIDVVTAQLALVNAKVTTMQTDGILPRAQERINAINLRLGRLEQRLEKLENE